MSKNQHNLFIVILIAICAGILVSMANGQSPIQIAEAQYVYTIETIVKTADTPDPDEPDSDVCPTCNGKGWVGDSTIRQTCPTCDGSGKRKRQEFNAVSGWPPRDFGVSSQQSEYPAWLDMTHDINPLPHITMYSLKSCQACDVFKVKEKPQLLNLVGTHRFSGLTVGDGHDLGDLLFPVFVVRFANSEPVLIDSSKSRITARQLASIVSRLKRKE